MTVGKDVKEGDQLWMLKEGLRTNFKVICSHCRGVGSIDELTKPCLQCVGKGHTTKYIPFIELLGSVRVESCTYDEDSDKVFLSVLRPPLYLLDAYRGDVVELCRDYWHDHEKGLSCAGAYRVGITDGPLLHRTLEEAKEAAHEMNMARINNVCDEEKTEPYEDPEHVLARIARYTTSESVTVFKETTIEDALC